MSVFELNVNVQIQQLTKVERFPRHGVDRGAGSSKLQRYPINNSKQQHTTITIIIISFVVDYLLYIYYAYNI